MQLGELEKRARDIFESTEVRFIQLTKVAKLSILGTYSLYE